MMKQLIVPMFVTQVEPLDRGWMTRPLELRFFNAFVMKQNKIPKNSNRTIILSIGHQYGLLYSHCGILFGIKLATFQTWISF